MYECRLSYIALSTLEAVQGHTQLRGDSTYTTRSTNTIEEVETLVSGQQSAS